MLKYSIILISVTVVNFLSEIYLDVPKLEGIDLVMWAFIILYISDRDNLKGESNARI